MLVEFDVERPAFPIFRKVGDHQGEATKDPAVATCPVEFFSIGFTFGEKRRVAPEKVVFLVPEQVVAGVVFLVHECEVFLVASDFGEPSPDRRRHKQGITPTPTAMAVGGVGFFMSAPLQ